MKRKHFKVEGYLTSGMMEIKMVKTECLALASSSKVSFQ